MNQLQTVYIAKFITATSAGLCLLTRDYRFVFIMIPAAIYINYYKPESKEENAKLEEFSHKVLAGSILLPIGLLLCFAIIGLIYIISR